MATILSALKTHNEETLVPVSHTHAVASIDLALLKNTHHLEEHEVDLITPLLKHDICFLDFIACFFSSPGGAFNINLLNKCFSPLLLNTQYYAGINGSKSHWSLYAQCIKAYSSKHSIPENKIPASLRINLMKECFCKESLATNSHFQNALDYTQMINVLQTLGQIKFTGNTDHHATVIANIQYQFYSKSLDVCIAAIFSYQTGIPCYRNVYIHPDHDVPNPYSKDEKTEEEVINQISLVTKDLFEDVVAQSKQNCKLSSSILNTIDDEIYNKDNTNYYDDQTIESLMTKQILCALNTNGDSDEDDESTSVDSHKFNNNSW